MSVSPDKPVASPEEVRDNLQQHLSRQAYVLQYLPEELRHLIAADPELPLLPSRD